MFISFITISSFSQEELNVMTFNIRFNNPGDSLNAWPHRREKVSSQILFHKAHLVGVQEALLGQLNDIKHDLKKFKFIGVGRADGKEKGEYSAILYDTTRLTLLKTETFWLAEKTNVPGMKGWDAAFERIVTWAKFRDKKSKREFYHFNTHFDHVGKTARKESALLLLKKVNEIAGKNPVIITGDFNAKPTDEPIMVIVDTGNTMKLTDAKSVSKTAHYGPTGTFNAFQSKETSNEPIDYIFIKNKVTVLQHATLSQSWNGRFSSDHFPVFAVIKIEK